MEFTATRTESTGGTFNRELHRLEHGEIVTRMPHFESEYGVPDPRRYTLVFSGYSDAFEELRYGATTQDDMIERVIIEFEITGSRKWEGVRFSQAFNIPVDWTDDRGKLHQLFSALQGRPIVEGDRISFTDMLGTPFEGVVDVKESQKGRLYPVVKTFLALETDDDEDEAPARPAKPTTNGRANGRGRAAAADDDDFPTR